MSTLGLIVLIARTAVSRAWRKVFVMRFMCLNDRNELCLLQHDTKNYVHLCVIRIPLQEFYELHLGSITAYMVNSAAVAQLFLSLAANDHF
jgi:hypothetical protein